MRPFRPLRDGSPPAALPALLRATHLLGLALGSALGRLRESGATAARMFERAEEQALVRRFADVVRTVVKTMELAGFGGNDLIARTLARAGWKLSSRTVGRIRKERWPLPRVSEAASMLPRAVTAKRPNHVWMLTSQT